VLLGIGLAYLFYHDRDTFTLDQIVRSNLQFCVIVMGQLSFTFAMRYGKGGIVQAIENQKTVLQTLWGVLINQVVPGYIEVIGMLVGVSGVILIVLQKRK